MAAKCSVKTKRVKAWAAVNPKTGAVLRNLEGEYAICTKIARADYQCAGYGRVVPCTITYDLPKNRAKK